MTSRGSISRDIISNCAGSGGAGAGAGAGGAGAGVRVGAGAGIGVGADGCWQPTSSAASNKRNTVVVQTLTNFFIWTAPYWSASPISNLNRKGTSHRISLAVPVPLSHHLNP